MIRTINPATGEPIEDYEEHSAAQIGRRLEAAERAWASWSDRPLAERAQSLLGVAGLLERRRDEHARLMTTEMGKTVKAARAEVDKCAWVCRHYAEQAGEYLRARVVDTDARTSYVRFDSIGPVLAVMPWNFPFWQVFRFAAPALMAGNVGLLKHASNVTGCALAIEAVFREAGLPDGCFQALVVRGQDVARIIEDDRVRAVTLTGSGPAGASVAAAAGARIKKTVLELGGSDPFIVLADAELEKAAEVACAARMTNSGQSCIAAKRFIVHRDVIERFTELLVSHVEKLRVGDPLDPRTDVGPLARHDLVEELDRQVRESVARGARARVGGERLDRPGFYYAPTVLSQVEPEQPAWAEETFGPAAAVLSVRDAEEALRVANASSFGLGASLWTRDLELAEKLAVRIEAGCVFVNEMVKSDPRLPFGGVKRSGYGRELGVEGIREFVNVKTVWIGQGSWSRRGQVLT